MKNLTSFEDFLGESKSSASHKTAGDFKGAEVNMEYTWVQFFDSILETVPLINSSYLPKRFYANLTKN
jgi:hypothetical protein